MRACAMQGGPEKTVVSAHARLSASQAHLPTQLSHATRQPGIVTVCQDSLARRARNKRTARPSTTVTPWRDKASASITTCASAKHVFTSSRIVHWIWYSWPGPKFRRRLQQVNPRRSQPRRQRRRKRAHRRRNQPRRQRRRKPAHRRR